ncbi:hypothetical protein ACHAW6_005252 [Cyclotella cf. meneghiniana]
MGSFLNPTRSMGSPKGIEGFILAMAAALASFHQARGARDSTFDQRANAAFLSSETRTKYRYNNKVMIRPSRCIEEQASPFLLPLNSICTCESTAKNIDESFQFNNLAGTEDMYIKLNPNNVERTSLQDTHALFGTLRGDGLIERYDVYRRVHSDPGFDAHHQKEIVAVDLKLGHKLNGHDKIVHGGIISLLIDEGLGWAAYESLVHHTGQISKEFTTENTLLVTANLNIDFRSPFMAGSEAVIRVHLDEDRTTGRKMYFVAKLESLDGSVVFAEATGLFLCVPKEKMSLP